MNVLQKGLNYKLHTKKANWIQNLALESETSIQSLPLSDRDIYRHTYSSCVLTVDLYNIIFCYNLLFKISYVKRLYKIWLKQWFFLVYMLICGNHSSIKFALFKLFT
jgi:hypothetical protein